MRVATAAGPPAFARPQRPSATEAPAAGASSTGDEPTTTRRGSDRPLTHALHQGNGQKTGIRRRFAEEILAQQAAAGLGDAAAADDVATSSPDPVTSEPAAPEPASELISEPVVDPADGTAPPDAKGTALAGETIVLDGTGFGVDLAVPAEVYDPLDELREAVEESTDGPVEELQQLLAEEIAAALEDDREQIDVYRV